MQSELRFAMIISLVSSLDLSEPLFHAGRSEPPTLCASLCYICTMLSIEFSIESTRIIRDFNILRVYTEYYNTVRCIIYLK